MSFIQDIENRFGQQLNNAKNAAFSFAQNVGNSLRNLYQKNVLNQSLTNVAKFTQPSISPLVSAGTYIGDKLGIKPPTVQNAVDFAASIPQAIARRGFEGVQTLAGDKNVYTPRPGIEQIALGKEPLYNMNDPRRTSGQITNALHLPAVATPIIAGLGTVADVTPFGVGEKKIGEAVAKEGLEQLGKAEARNTLKGLLSYTNDLVNKLHMSPDEAEKIGYNKAQELLKQRGRGAENLINLPKSVPPQQVLSFDKSFAKWIGQREVAKTVGTQVSSRFADIPENIGMDVIHAIEDPAGKYSEDVLKYSNQLKGQFDSLYKQAEKDGLDVGYLNNYITHIWKQSPQEVEEAFNSARQSFKFGKGRVLPTYRLGISLGLTPKYTHPAEILQEYVRRLGETKANLNLFSELKKGGFIVDAPEGRMNGFEPIVGKGFPSSTTVGENGETVIGQYYARPEIARVLNRVFSPPDTGTLGKALQMGGNFSSKVQDISLAGGIPKTPVNAFSIMAGLQREILAGRVVSPISDFVRSFSGKASNEFFEKNIGQVKKMQSLNIPINTSYDVSNLIDRGAVKSAFGDSLGEAWDKSFNDPTFRRFFPALQINLFTDIEKKALSQGLAEHEATQIAADAVKRFYGVVDTATSAKRSELGEDFLRTFAFAPKFRETMINFWKETGKAVSPVHYSKAEGLKLNNPLSLQNQMNTRFVVGAIGAYISYDYLNWKLNGKHLFQNPDGKKGVLLIPAGDTTIGIPFLSSIATLPLAGYGMAESAIHGDIQGTLNQGKQFLSSGFKPLLDVGTNQNYFGQSIYNQNDSQADRLKDIVGYIGGAYAHPYMRALAEAGFVPGIKGKDQPSYQTISKAVELPFRYYKTSSMNAGYYFSAEKDAIKGLNPEQKQIYDQLHKKNSDVDEDALPIYDRRSAMANALLRLANPEIVSAETKTALDTHKQTGEPIAPFYVLSPKQQQTVLLLKTFYPGDSTKSQIIKQNPWLQQYYDLNDQYIKYMQDKGVFSKSAIDSDKPEVTPDLSRKLAYYNSLPSGTGARSEYIRQNPEISDFFNATRDYNNKQREALGLPPIANNEFTPYTKKGKHISATYRKPKKISISSRKIETPKLLAQVPSLPRLAVRHPSQLKLKPLVKPQVNESAMSQALNTLKSLRIGKGGAF